MYIYTYIHIHIYIYIYTYIYIRQGRCGARTPVNKTTNTNYPIYVKELELFEAILLQNGHYIILYYTILYYTILYYSKLYSLTVANTNTNTNV